MCYIGYGYRAARHARKPSSPRAFSIRINMNSLVRLDDPGTLAFHEKVISWRAWHLGEPGGIFDLLRANFQFFIPLLENTLFIRESFLKHFAQFLCLDFRLLNACIRRLSQDDPRQPVFPLQSSGPSHSYSQTS
ncbi:hypothetical protein RCIA22 [Methanocella arvoryzae MRE50]|uniref:Uncharacterized protein n=1 Tax=Methanocella arvoryzae (strain DSM 22066 / NBRC 105507 / MRE50) TaxID=351160 RepID=Q0W6P0_METAR|nr:hypothetical protein RCIA22 [Methanocella arvoryzae MRE50]